MSSDLLPANATPAERALSVTISRAASIPVPLRELWDPDTCPIAILPWLAWAFSVDDWSSDWTEEQQRAAVKASYAVHRYKGTIGSVKDALNALGLGVQVQEWFNQIPQGDPYTFKLLLELSEYGVSLGDLNKVIELVESTKNLRSHLDDVQVTVKSRANPRVAAATGFGTEIVLTNYVAAGGSLITNELAIVV